MASPSGGSGSKRMQLPERSTRGKRMKAQLADEEDEADVEFWNQEFFAEDAADADYASEKEEEDVPDSDFFESESEDDEDGEEEVRERKKKTLRPPGAPPGGGGASSKPRAAKPPKPPAASSPSAAAAAAAAGPGAASPQQQQPHSAEQLSHSVIFEATYEAPTLRKSTRTRMEVAQKERQQREQHAKATRRPQKQGEYRVLTQEELLAEAARTELDNLASLKLMLAAEEETKRKANVKKQRFGGPLIRSRSRAIQVLVTAEEAAREQQEQQQLQQDKQADPAPGAAPAAAAAAAGSADVKQEPTAAAEAPAATAAAAAGEADTPALAADAPAQEAASAEPTAMDIDQPQQQQQQPDKPPEPDQQQQPEQPEQPQGPVLQRQALNTLQCVGMKAPKWLLPQRAPGPAPKPICPITGAAARYRDPLTGHFYSDAEAFRELRRRLGQPLPPTQPYRRLAASPAAELQALLGPTAAAAAAGAGDPTAAAAEPQQPAAAALPAADEQQQQQHGGLRGLPAGQLQLQQVVEKYVAQQLDVASGKGKSQAVYQQQPAPDEVAALVLQVSQAVHG